MASITIRQFALATVAATLISGAGATSLHAQSERSAASAPAAPGAQAAGSAQTNQRLLEALVQRRAELVNRPSSAGRASAIAFLDRQIVTVLRADREPSRNAR